MKIHLKLSVVDDQGEPFMGRGPAELLQGIARLGSINRAAKEMKMSYVKALKIIKRLETGLGSKVLKTEIGGKEHGGAELTLLAARFLDCYRDYETKVTTFAQEKFTSVMEWEREAER